MNTARHPHLVLDFADGAIVEYKHRVTGRVHPPSASPQLLVLADDNQWYLQKDAVVENDGRWSIEATFGYPDSVHSFNIVATAGEKITTSPLAQIPALPASRSVMVRRIK